MAYKSLTVPKTFHEWLDERARQRSTKMAPVLRELPSMIDSADALAVRPSPVPIDDNGWAPVGAPPEFHAWLKTNSDRLGISMAQLLRELPPVVDAIESTHQVPA